LVVFLVLLIVAVFAITLVSAWLGDNRRTQLMAWARANGMTYQQESRDLARRWSDSPFIGGPSARALDVISGTTSTRRQFYSYTYQYIVPTGKSAVVIRAWVTVVRLPRELPWLTVTPETIGGKLSKTFGGQDINVESVDFNRDFRVQSELPEFAIAFLHPQLIEWLLGSGRGLVPFRVIGQHMLCWQADTQLDTSQLMAVVDGLDALASQIPAFIWDDYGHIPGNADPLG